MNNTWIKLTDSRCKKLIEALDSLPMSSRDATYNQIKQEINQIIDVWKHIDIKSIHRSKVQNQAKNNRGRSSR